MKEDAMQKAVKQQDRQMGPSEETPKRDFVDRLGDTIERNYANPSRKIGAGHFAAWIRSGLKELTQILPAFNNGVQPVEEPGLYGVPTNIEIVQEKQGGSLAHAVPTSQEMSPLEQFRGRPVEPTRQKEVERG